MEAHHEFEHRVAYELEALEVVASRVANGVQDRLAELSERRADRRALARADFGARLGRRVLRSGVHGGRR